MIEDLIAYLKRPSPFLTHKVTLSRLGAPMLYAYDAKTFRRRLCGLHSVPPLGPCDAIMIRPCKAIHTFGQKETIDVMFMNKYGIVLKLTTLKPWRITGCLKSVVAVEMAEGTAKRINMRVGQKFKPSEGYWFW